MTGRKSKSLKERTSVVEVPVKIRSKTFVTEFLRFCEEYEVYPMPKLLLSNGEIRRRSTERYSQIKIAASVLKLKNNDVFNDKFEKESPVFILTYEHPKKLENLQKIESKGHEVSICILDSLYSTMQIYRTVTTLKLPNCRINAYGVMQIAQMLREIGCIRDLNLDRNPNDQENYDLLCSSPGKLLYLSLKLCGITDTGVIKIANRLKYKDPPKEPKLVALNLANNQISETGAQHIASMLRTNRSLQSLVLSGNRICDSGAALIIHELCMSFLTRNEITDLRRRRFAELKRQNEKQPRSHDADSNLEQIHSRESQDNVKRRSSIEESRKSLRQESWRKRKEGENPSKSKEIINNISEAEVRYPFLNETTPVKDSVSCSGNFRLQHLNLSFNRLTNVTVEALVSCLRYQNDINAGDLSKGLLHVFLEGNDFTVENNKTWSELLEIINSKKFGNQTNIRNSNSV